MLQIEFVLLGDLSMHVMKPGSTVEDTHTVFFLSGFVFLRII